MRDRQSTPDTKSHHSQPTKERETQRTTAQEEALVTQQDPLTQTISRIGSPPSAKVHANLLSRATADHPARGRQLMLQMQRQYGNRYVQRVVELSRQGAGETEATPEVEATIEQARGGGRSLDAGIQRQMESAFGNNFSGVRVHTDSTADALNQSLSARAFTTGQDIFFRQGEYNPGSSTGKELLAHELTHVVQQTGTVRGKLAIGEAGDRYEQEADKVASEVLQRLDAPAAVQRQEAIEEELQAKPEITALQRQEEPDEELQAKPSISALQRQEEAKNPNQTGLPDELKAGVENLSGYSLDDVRVHYNSSKPAQLQALAYTQGTEIHVGPGQEKHLAHEAWHVVQQMQGRVKPTMQMKGVQINDDEGLEREADVMGVKALKVEKKGATRKSKKTRQRKEKGNEGSSKASFRDLIYQKPVGQLLVIQRWFYMEEGNEYVWYSWPVSSFFPPLEQVKDDETGQQAQYKGYGIWKRPSTERTALLLAQNSGMISSEQREKVEEVKENLHNEAKEYKENILSVIDQNPQLMANLEEGLPRLQESLQQVREEGFLATISKIADWLKETLSETHYAKIAIPVLLFGILYGAYLWLLTLHLPWQVNATIFGLEQLLGYYYLYRWKSGVEKLPGIASSSLLLLNSYLLITGMGTEVFNYFAKNELFPNLTLSVVPLGILIEKAIIKLVEVAKNKIKHQ